MSSCGYTRGCERLCTFARAPWCVCVSHATLPCVTSPRVHVSVQAGREAAGRFWCKDCKLTRETFFFFCPLTSLFKIKYPIPRNVTALPSEKTI